MGFRQLIARFIAVERRVKQAFPISAVPPLIAQETSRGTIIRDTRTAGYLEDFDGWITDKGGNGEKDYTDARYWVRKGLPQPGIAETDALTFSMMPPSTDDRGASLFDDIVTVHNLPEMPPNQAETTDVFNPGHYLRVGQHVRVRAAHAVDSTRHYIMSEPPPAGEVPLDLTNDGGSAGDSSTLCSFTYSVKYVGGTKVLGAHISPDASFCRAWPMKATAAGKGLGYWQGGTIHISIAFETTSNKTCTT